MSQELERQQRLVRRLLDPARYPHGAQAVEHIETHISHLLLAGDYAYKIKKPLNLGFLDFTRLADRAHFCAEEIRLNGRLAPDIYLRRVAIAGTPEAPQIDGAGPPIEYAVEMRRFPQEALLDRRLAAGELAPELMDALALRIARFHASAARAKADSPYGHPPTVIQPMRENFAQFDPLPAADPLRRRLEGLAVWTEARFTALRETLERRLADGFVRECHGDMHLGNIAVWKDTLIIFDGIEFNAELRWIDVVSELAFLTMDLDARDAPAYARRVLNGWLEQSGDYAGLALLRFYQVYRCMVRAKVHAIRAAQPEGVARERAAATARVEDYVRLAQSYTAAAQPQLVITHGFSGSGKTWAARRLVEARGFVQVRSDVERKRLHGLAAEARTDSGLQEGIYSAPASDATYARLAELAAAILEAGFPVVVDATFLERERRQAFARLAAQQGVPFHILDLVAPRAVLEARIRDRHASGADASEADLAVLDRQLRTHQPFSAAERPHLLQLAPGDAPETLFA